MSIFNFILLTLGAWGLFCLILAVGEWLCNKAYLYIKPYRDFVDRIADE